MTSAARSKDIYGTRGQVGAVDRVSHHYPVTIDRHGFPELIVSCCVFCHEDGVLEPVHTPVAKDVNSPGAQSRKPRKAGTWRSNCDLITTDRHSRAETIPGCA